MNGTLNHFEAFTRTYNYSSFILLIGEVYMSSKECLLLFHQQMKIIVFTIVYFGTL